MKIKFKSVLSIVLICLMFVACFSGCKKETPQPEPEPMKLQEDLYLAVCDTQGFKVYSQEVTKESSSGIVKGYIATLTSSKIQTDFYEFENSDYANAALGRLSEWVSSEYGSTAEETVSEGRTDWSFNTEEVYAKAVRVDKYLLYIFCSDINYKEQAKTIFEEIAVIG